MKTTITMILFLLGVQEAAAVIHSLKYLTASSGVPNLPEFVVVGMVDDVPIAHYDSDTKKGEPTQDWMIKLTEDDPQHLEGQTALALDQQQVFKANFETLKQLFNHTGGVHTYQLMVGCEWDEETNELNGIGQFGYDGENFISFDLKTQTWIASNQQALITKHNWDSDKADIAQWKNYLSQIFPEWLKKYLNYGRSSLRTVLPSVSLLQRSSSSPITCHSTGFYPHRAELFWKKDGEELHEGVHKGEILPNHDGTFQMSVDLDLSAVGSEDWNRYSCVFQLSGVNEEITTKLDKAGIRSNEGGSVIIAVVVTVVVLAAVAVIGFIIYKKRTDKRSPSPVENPEVQEQMVPTA